MSWRLVLSWDAESDHFSTELVAPLPKVEAPRPAAAELHLVQGALREEDCEESGSAKPHPQ